MGLRAKANLLREIAREQKGTSHHPALYSCSTARVKKVNSEASYNMATQSCMRGAKRAYEAADCVLALMRADLRKASQWRTASFNLPKYLTQIRDNIYALECWMAQQDWRIAAEAGMPEGYRPEELYTRKMTEQLRKTKNEWRDAEVPVELDLFNTLMNKVDIPYIADAATDEETRRSLIIDKFEEASIFFVFTRHLDNDALTARILCDARNKLIDRANAEPQYADTLAHGVRCLDADLEDLGFCPQK